MKNARKVVLTSEQRSTLVSEMIMNTPEKSYWSDEVMNNASRALDLKSPVVRFRGMLPARRKAQYNRVLTAWVTMQELSDAQVVALHAATRGIKGRYF